MPREQLVMEAKAAAAAAKHNLKWMDKHPDRYDQAKRADMQQYLRMLINFAKNEQKNTRSAKRASVLSQLKDLFVSIIPHAVRRGLVK